MLSCSNDFRHTLDSIVKGLNGAGFSRKDYRISDEKALVATEQPKVEQETLFTEEDIPTPDEEEGFADIEPEHIKEQTDRPQEENKELDAMEQQAQQQTESYTKANEAEDFMGGAEAEMQHRYQIKAENQETAQKLRLPKFCIKDGLGETLGLFEEGAVEYDYLEPEHLLEGFRLSGQDANVNFKLAASEMYAVDIAKSGEAVPQYRMVTSGDKQRLREYLDRLPQERQIATCIDAICAVINKKNAYESSDIKGYVRRVVDGLHSDDLVTMLTSKETYAKKIQDKIDSLAEAYKQKKFMQLFDAGQIECCERYELPAFITSLDATDSLPKALYEAEKNDMNEYERKVLDIIIGQENVLWWHRIIERQGFCINGFIKHYPDFLVLTKSGKVVLVEAKGDHLANDDSEMKLLLGRKWQEAAGRDYRYMMVFAKKDFQHDGAYTLDEFAEVMKKL